MRGLLSHKSLSLTYIPTACIKDILEAKRLVRTAMRQMRLPDLTMQVSYCAYELVLVHVSVSSYC